MSEAPSHDPDPPRRGLSLVTLSLAFTAGVSVIAAVVFAVLFLRDHRVGGAATLNQQGSVTPGSNYNGVVFYPIPFAAPPNLKVSSAHRQYDIVKQDEAGFTWKALATIDDIRDDPNIRRNAEGMLGVGIRHAESLKMQLRPDLRFEDFTWEATGLRPDPTEQKPFAQEGQFNTVAGTEGEVNFPLPYRAAPNVELVGLAAAKVIIVESRPTGFKWKNAGKDDSLHSGILTWKAKGLRSADNANAK